MKKLTMALMICLCVAFSCIPGYCEEDLGASLDSEINSEANESAGEEATASEEFDAGEPMAP